MMSTSKQERDLIRKRSARRRPRDRRDRRPSPYVDSNGPSLDDAMEEFIEDYAGESSIFE